VNLNPMPVKKHSHPFLFRLFATSILLSLVLTACDPFLGLPFQQMPQKHATATAKPSDISATEAVVDGSTTLTPSPTPDGVNELVIWVPPLMDPEADTPEAALLKQRLLDFESEHPGVTVIVRVKARSGQSGLMESLISTATVAPLATPSLILLGRKDLEVAAKRGLILPMDDYSTVINDLDWFQYARAMAIIGESTFGLPFAGNALVMAYRETEFDEEPDSWEQINSLQKTVYFSAGNTYPAFPLALYLSLGGSLRGDTGQPNLDVEKLTTILTILAEGRRAGVFPSTLIELTDPAMIWDAYKAGTTNAAVIWANYYLADQPEDTNIIPLISLTDYDFTIADGWMIGLADPLPERRALAVELAEYLVDVRFVAAWNQEAGYLPMREAAFALWEDSTLVETLSLVSYSARMDSSTELMDTISPVMVEAVNLVLGQGEEPETAAAVAVEKLNAVKE